MSRWKQIINIADDFISLLLPRLCHACGEHLVRNEKVVCTCCLVDIPKTGFHIQRDNDLEKGFWGRCRIERAAAYAFYSKGGKMQKLVHRLKYSGFKEIGIFFGTIYGTMLRDSGFMNGIDAIIPVPLHISKERTRGFNQSEVIASGISASTGIEVITGNLSRIMKTGSQTRRGRYERWENVASVFTVVDPGSIRGKHLLLVDDVITTGSTIEGCASVLDAAGCRAVSAVALAASIAGTT